MRPLGRTVMGRDVVLWRSGDQILAWDDYCAHRGVRLSLGSVCEEGLRCAYHGWVYGSTGRVVRVPAHPDYRPRRAGARRVYHAEEHLDLVWVCLGDDPEPLPTAPGHEREGLRVFSTGPYPIEAAAPRVLENFLDLSHPPVLHGGLLGTSDHTEIPDYDVRRSARGIFVDGIRYWQPDPDGTGVAQEVSYDFGVLAPLTAYFTKHVAEGGQYLLSLAVRPVHETASVAYLASALDYAHDVPQQEFDEFQTHIISQDRPILESQRPARLPLDPRAEVHVRSDRFTSAYRRYLKRLGLRYGTC